MMQLFIRQQVNQQQIIFAFYRGGLQPTQEPVMLEGEKEMKD